MPSLPGIGVALAFCLIYGWYILLPGEYQQLGRHVRGGALYISNFVLNREAGYFDVDARLKPLVHLWSLAIEEQFYIAWPIFAVIFYRRRIDLFALIALLLAISFVANVMWIGVNPVEAYFLPFTRAWELLVGVLLAYFAHFGWIGRKFPSLKWDRIPLADLAALSGLSAIIISASVFDTGTAFPGWWGLAPVLGTALLIAAGQNAWVNRTVLAHPVAVFVGLISYPLYLWHWPLLSLARIIEGESLPIAHGLTIIGISLVLAVLTYRLVEQPIRSGARSRPYVAAALVVVLCGLGIAGNAIAEGDVRPRASRLGIDNLLAAADERYIWMTDVKTLHFEGRTIWTKEGTKGSVLFLGDSNIEQYWPRAQILVSTAPQSHKTALILTEGNCPPLPGVGNPANAHCMGIVDAARDLVEKQNVDSVVIAGFWWSYFIAPNKYRWKDQPLASPDGVRQALAGLEAVMAKWVAQGRHVYLVLNIPIGDRLDPKNLIGRTFLSLTVNPLAGVPRAELDDRYGAVSRALRDTASRAGAVVIDPLDALCMPNGMCPATTPQGEPIYRNSNHLSATYVREHVEYLDVALRN